MKTQTDADKLLEIAQENNLSLKSIYSFQLKGRQVRVIFSDRPNARTIEEALVKVATRKII